MRITAVKPLAVWGGFKNYLFVKVETDEGISGIGEAGLSWREMAVAEGVRHLESFLVGQDPFRIEHLWQRMFRGGFFPAGRVLGAAISAIDIALWDIQGKALSVPVYQLLGGRVRDRVVCYPHTGGATPEELGENARRLREEGWKFIRFSVPSDGEMLEPRWAIRQTVRLCEGVKAAVGDDLEICLDLHTRLDPMDAIPLCRELERFNPYFLEDPIRSENPATFHQLRRHIHSPIAAGEQFATKWEFRELIEEELINYARIDLCIAGGLTEARKIAGWCETHYINIAPHNPLGPVSTAACLHLCLATSNFGVQELPSRPGKLLADVVPVQVDFQDGYLLPSDRPGLGIEFDEAAARALAPQYGQPPELRRADGSFTNW
jgi:L-alanine-DL-glutamate epimerase-like enolase superfamily enzyme